MVLLTSQYVLEFPLSVDVFDAHISQFKEVLHCVRGCIHQDELLAIMGPRVAVKPRYWTHYQVNQIASMEMLK